MNNNKKDLITIIVLKKHLNYYDINCVMAEGEII